MSRVYLTNCDRITKDENNLVNVVYSSGEKADHLEPRRLFPVSFPDKYITFLDENGTEICVARSIGDLDCDSAKVLKDSLDDYYLVPVITRIIRTETKYGILRWTVETDRGVRSFDIRNRSHDIRSLPDGTIRVRDSNDNRYNIKGIESLDSHSRSLLIADL